MGCSLTQWPTKSATLALQRNLLAGGDQCPGLGKAEGEIVVRHGDAAVGIPGSARAHVKQSAACIRQHRTGIGKAQRKRAPGCSGAGKTTATMSLPRRDNSLPSMASFWMNSSGLPFVLDLLHLQIARELEEHNARRHPA